MSHRFLCQTFRIASFSTDVGKRSSQSLLAALRKKTGYTISNCKKALETCENDPAKAEEWLNSQAQTQGWDKAAKLQSRQTPNGLIGIIALQNHAAMIEVNCETDFVAKNEKFQSFVANATKTCFKMGHSVKNDFESSFLQNGFSSEQLGALNVIENSGESTMKLSDLLALNIGRVGENMTLRRGVTLQVAKKNHKIACCTHPLQNQEETLMGKYGALVVYEENSSPPEPVEALADCPATPEINVEILPKQLCQHIIGMSPKTVKKTDDDPSSSDETALYSQEFVANPEFTVGEILARVGWDVKGFIRYECGEPLE